MKNFFEAITGKPLTMAAAVIVSVVGISVYADDHRSERRGRFEGAPDVVVSANPLYEKECGSCHFAYPAGLLPARSWEALMGKLENHFGDNAELASSDRAALLEYLRTNSAERSQGRASAKILRSISPGETPLRITETSYFRRKHSEIPPQLYAKNSPVKSIANCKSCHTGAARGSFNEHAVVIPGYGGWE